MPDLDQLRDDLVRLSTASPPRSTDEVFATAVEAARPPRSGRRALAVAAALLLVVGGVAVVWLVRSPDGGSDRLRSGATTTTAPEVAAPQAWLTALEPPGRDPHAGDDETLDPVEPTEADRSFASRLPDLLGPGATIGPVSASTIHPGDGEPSYHLANVRVQDEDSALRVQWEQLEQPKRWLRSEAERRALGATYEQTGAGETLVQGGGGLTGTSATAVSPDGFMVMATAMRVPPKPGERGTGQELAESAITVPELRAFAEAAAGVDSSSDAARGPWMIEADPQSRCCPTYPPEPAPDDPDTAAALERLRSLLPDGGDGYSVTKAADVTQAGAEQVHTGVITGPVEQFQVQWQDLDHPIEILFSPSLPNQPGSYRQLPEGELAVEYGEAATGDPHADRVTFIGPGGDSVMITRTDNSKLGEDEPRASTIEEVIGLALRRDEWVR